MNVTLEQIDNLRNRANVSYGEAKEALEVNNGNMIDAIIYLESEQKTVYDNTERQRDKQRQNYKSQQRKEHYKSAGDDLVAGFKKVLSSLNNTRVIMFNTERTVFDVSMTITLLAALFVFPLLVTVLVIGIFTGNKFKIKRKHHMSDAVNDIFTKASQAREDLKEAFVFENETADHQA